MELTDEQRLAITEDDDYVALRRHNYSARAVAARYPEGAPARVIQQALGLATEAEVAQVYDRYFDVVRYPARHNVSPLDVERRHPGWLDGLPIDFREDQGRALIDRAEQEIKRQYLSRSLYGAEVVTTVTPLERNRVNVTFTMTEGEAAKIREIRIVGTVILLAIVALSCVWSCATGEKLIEDRPDWSVTRG